MEQTVQLVLDALKRAGLKEGNTLAEVAIKITAHLTPTVTVIERTETKLTLDITSSVDGSLFCGITTGNKNLKAYSFPEGHQNALTRIGHFDHIVSDKYMGQLLQKIALVELIRPLPLGETIRISITEISKDGQSTISEVMGWSLRTDKELMKKSTITTYKQ